MKCAQYRYMASLALDDALHSAQQARLDAHLLECADCRSYALDLQRQKALCAGLEEPLPPQFSQRWQQQCRERSAPPSFARNARLWGSLAAAVLVVGFGLMMTQRTLHKSAQSAHDEISVAQSAVAAGGAEDAGAAEPRIVTFDEQVLSEERALVSGGNATPAVEKDSGASNEAAPQAPAARMLAAPKAPPAPEGATYGVTLLSDNPEDARLWLTDYMNAHNITAIAVTAQAYGGAKEDTESATAGGMADSNTKSTTADTAAASGFSVTLSQTQFDALIKSWADNGGQWKGQFAPDLPVVIEIHLATE